MKVYKLFRIRRDGTLGSLFINRKKVLTIGEWHDAEKTHKTKGYSFRPHWHCCDTPNAPHLSMKNRAWYLVEIKEYEEMKRPEAQGGKWYIADKIKIIKKL